MYARFPGKRCNSTEGYKNMKHENATVGSIHIRGLSGSYPDILSISRTGRVALV
jgi:hypothetical protein